MARHSYEDELRRKLKFTVGALVVTVVFLYVALTSFGPKIGSAFLIFSKYRNDTGPGDIVPPTAPVFSDTPNATNKEEITLNGITEAGATVTIYVNGPIEGETTADNEGLFTFIDLPLKEGRNIIFAKAKDGEGNESEKSYDLIITLDDEAPGLEITSPSNGETVKNLDKRVLIKGTTNEKCSVLINGRSAVTKPDNSFELLLGVGEGDVTITVKASDEAGNEVEKVINIKYEKSS